MDIYLPIAEISLHLEVILGLGIVVGFISSVFGIGGGFIATPFLIFLGVPPAFAVGTQAVQLVSSSLSGVLGHWSRGNVDVQVGSVMLAGSLTGTAMGIGIFHFLQYTGQIDVVINILYVLLLGTIGSTSPIEPMPLGRSPRSATIRVMPFALYRSSVSAMLCFVAPMHDRCGAAA